MKIVIAPDSFKGSLTSIEAARAMQRGLARVWPKAEYLLFPMADGGEGTVEALVAASCGQLMKAEVEDPFGRPIKAAWGLMCDGRTAVVETAAAAGLSRLAPNELNPARSSTFGLGQLIAKALEHPQVERLLVGLGGSATNDGGAGLLSALGVKFLGKDGQLLEPGGAALEELEHIDAAGLNPALARVNLVVACDVDNPLIGPEGASAVFGPQKGAGPELVRRLDSALARYAQKAVQITGRAAVPNQPGAGAAGGLGAAFMFFTEASFRPGAQLVLEEGDFMGRAAGADLIITGEGRSDGQTARGKAPVGVAGLGRALGVPVVLLSGSLGEGHQKLYDQGLAALMSASPAPMDLAEAMARADELLEEAAERLARLLSVQLPAAFARP